MTPKYRSMRSDAHFHNLARRARLAACMMLAVPAGICHAQSVSAGGSPGTTFTTPIASTLVPYNAALPVPIWGGFIQSGYPAQRGFVRAEPFFIYPMIASGFGVNSNVLLQSTGAVRSSFVQFAPRITADVRSGGQSYALTYQGNLTRFSNSSADNYFDHEVIGQARNQFSARADLNVQAYYLSRSEGRGTLNRVLNSEPDRFGAMGASGTFGYGAQAAQGRFEFDLGLTDKRYDNFRQVNSAFDVSTFNFAGRFLYRIAPRMRLLAELRDTEYHYKSNNLDSSERRLMFGASMDAGAAISGTAKLGVVRKDFKDGAFRTLPRRPQRLRYVGYRLAIQAGSSWRNACPMTLPVAAPLRSTRCSAQPGIIAGKHM